MSLLTGIIPTQNFELIRDRLGLILFDEFLGQSYPVNVFVETFVPEDKVSAPSINISLDKGSYIKKTQSDVKGRYVYNIDITTSAKARSGVGGDYRSAVMLQKIVGMCRAILEAPVYKTLDFPTPFNGMCVVQRIEFYNPRNIGDAAFVQKARLVFIVEVGEDVELQTGTELRIVGTTARLGDTEQGYHYEINPDINGFFVSEGEILFVDENGLFNYLPEELSDMALKFSEVTTAPSLDEMGLIVGIKDNGDGTFTNYNFTSDQLFGFVADKSRKVILITEAGASFSDSWIDGKDVQELTTNNQSYLKDVGFTQDGDTIAGMDFYVGQKIILRL